MMERVKIYNEENFNYEMLTIPLKKLSDKFLAVVKLNTGEEVIAKIDIAPELDVIALDCPAMIGHSSFTRKPGISVIKSNLG